jgi:hypothetical protein
MRDCATNEMQRLDAYEASWERQIEELKAKVAELEAALERKVEATTEAPKEEGSGSPERSDRFDRSH